MAAGTRRQRRRERPNGACLRRGVVIGAQGTTARRGRSAATGLALPDDAVLAKFDAIGTPDFLHEAAHQRAILDPGFQFDAAGERIYGPW